ncbi:MAG: 3-dehydroquinate dehydratase, partial [Deferribacterales bacterium]|nr:3-dehydroquinate dehydratase [Deferribacterales bacterium]
KSMLSDLAVGLITGLGIHGYLYAIDYFADNN